MSTKKETVKTCDVCGKRVSDGGETYFGGHPHAGWFAVEMHGGPTDLSSLKSQKQWDVCGAVCLEVLGTQLNPSSPSFPRVRSKVKCFPGEHMDGGCP